MPRYELVSIDEFRITNVQGDPEKALASLGGTEGVKKLVEAFINGGSEDA